MIIMSKISLVEVCVGTLINFLLYDHVASYCTGSSNTATLSIKYLSHRNYSNNEYCTFYISPSSTYDNSFYFLEIQWRTFDVKGNMPDCNGDYAEVFLTRNRSSIGKYCSDNTASKPFNMYSYDGRIKIIFKSNSSGTGSGFQISYRMRRRSSNYLGYSSCSNTNNWADSGVLYSPKYPNDYSGTGCTYKINALSDKATKIVFMDINLRYYGSLDVCSSYDDYLTVKGSDSSSSGYYGATTVKDDICRTSSIITVTSKKKYVFVKFHKNINVLSSPMKTRGFLAGYIIYDAPKDTKSAGVVGVIAGVIVAVIVLIVIIILVVYCCKKKRNPGVVRLNQPTQGTTHVTSTTVTANTGQYPQQNLVPLSDKHPQQPYPQQPYTQQPYPQQPYPQQPYPPSSSNSAGFSPAPPPYSQSDSYPAGYNPPPVNQQPYPAYPPMDSQGHHPLQQGTPYPPQEMPSHAPQPQGMPSYPPQAPPGYPPAQ